MFKGAFGNDNWLAGWSAVSFSTSAVDCGMDGEVPWAAPPPPPATKSVSVSMTAAGNVADYNPAKQASLIDAFASTVSVSASAVTLAITAGSVNLVFTVQACRRRCWRLPPPPPPPVAQYLPQTHGAKASRVTTPRTAVAGGRCHRC
jgi:hypothetical protein